MKTLQKFKQLLDELHSHRSLRIRQQRQFLKELVRTRVECRQTTGDAERSPADCLPGHDRWREGKEEFFRKHQDFRRYHRHLRTLRPLILLFNLVIWFLLFRYLGVKTIAIVFAGLMGMVGVYQFFFLRRLEKRIFEPISRLKQGVEEIAQGNYDVAIECEVLNDLTLLVASFNNMARKLKEGEQVKAEYEENRKQLIANISHDLKTPITSIQGYIEALLDRSVQPAAQRDKYLHIIYNNTVYMNKLIDDLFLFAKLDLDKLEFRFQRTPVRNFMADLMEEFRLELEEQGIAFTYEDRLERDYTVNIDGKRIHQVIKNLIANAIKYGPEDGLAIDTTLCRAEREDYVVIRLSDNGPGIPEDQMAHVFDRFYRIDPERTKNGPSTGLGLAIARELVEAHGGRIAIASQRGDGSCFTIELPSGG
jgi:signal transduction histidine kinase